MKVTTKGQVTIPQEIRKRFGMEPGTEVEFTAKNGEVVVRPVDLEQRRAKFERALQRLSGSATSGLTTDEIMAMTRGED